MGTSRRYRRAKARRRVLPNLSQEARLHERSEYLVREAWRTLARTLELQVEWNAMRGYVIGTLDKEGIDRMNKRIQQAMDELKAALDEELKVDIGHQIFGGPDGVPLGSVVRFQRNYGHERVYAFVGVYVERIQGDKKWYITGTERVFTHEKLIEEHLLPSIQEGFRVMRTGGHGANFHCWGVPSQLLEGRA